jgi:phosphatidate cytidylyltransferase
MPQPPRDRPQGSRRPSGDRRRPPSEPRRPPADEPRRPPADEPRRPRQGRPEQRRERESKPRSDLVSRIIVAVPAALLALIVVKLGGAAFAVVMFLFGVASMQELYSMLERWKPIPVVGFVAMAALAAGAQVGGLRQVMLAAVAAVPVLFIFVIAQSRRANATVTIAATLLGVYWIGLAFAHAVLLRRLPHGGGILLDVLLGTFLGDTAAYLGGRAFGRRPLAPTISPNKTVEGLFCGMLVAVLAVVVGELYQPWLTQVDGLLLGVTVAVLGPLGDLFESLIKRDAGAKDAGKLFGAHGGALDRLDAVMFTVVAGYYVWSAVVH